MKKLVSIVLCFAILLALSATAFAAEFTASKTLVKDSVTEVKVVDGNGNEVKTDLKVVASDVTGGDRQNFKSRNEAIIMVTSVADAMEANDKEGANAKDDKITKTGLTVAENKVLAEAFNVVKETKTTEKLFAEIGLEAEEGVVANDYVAAALFDVSMNDAAVEAVGEDGKVALTVEVPGVKAGDKVIVVKLAADGTAMTGEYLEAAVNADGTVTFTMIGSGPVLVLVNPVG